MSQEPFVEGGGRSGRRTTNELVLPQGEFAYTRDTTSGVTFVRCGPCVVNAQAQDEPVVFNVKTGRFETVALSEAAQTNTIVPTGHYAVLNNPSTDSAFPKDGGKEVAKDLLIGQRVHIPGPGSFALWPRQHVKVIEGHQLRSNQYLLVRVYDEEAAKANWGKAVVKKATPAVAPQTPDPGTTEGDPPEMTAPEGETVEVTTSSDIPEDLSVGRLLIIRGTQVSFYIPPTGIEVVADDDGNYVREAVTLERLQYSILIDEDGNKRYVRGPDVVFPLPTERFHENDDGERIFRPIELNGNIQGMHIKVIAAYNDDEGLHGSDGQSYKEGEELFITGETTPIYFPCEQHSAIRYDGKTKHYATAIPAGDGRYVLNRHTGEIQIVEGGEKGRMFLPDPRTHVFGRRALTDSECETMYPGNIGVLEYNRALRELQAKAPTTRKGIVSEGEVRRAARRKRRGDGGGAEALVASAALNVGGAEFADASFSHGGANIEMGDEFTRKATYTEPRTVTLGADKFAGVPKIDIWNNYAIMVVDTSGKRRVEVGPGRVLLGFNETLEALTLSTGKPKTTDNLLNTAFLRVKHNKVTDMTTASTSDHVKVSLKYVLRINFEGDEPEKWFDVSNYVKLLCDHTRSRLKAAIRHISVEDFFREGEDHVRDIILGKKPEDGVARAGMFFEENAMRVYDVEVLMVEIGDSKIQDLLYQAQHEAVQSSVQLAREHRRLAVEQEQERIKRDSIKAQAETSEFQAEVKADEIARSLKTALATIRADLERIAQEQEKQTAADELAQLTNTNRITRERATANNNIEIEQAREAVRLDAIKKEAEARIAQLQAMEKGFSEALLAIQNSETLIKVAEAMSVQSFLGGKDLPEVVAKVFAGTPLEDLVQAVQRKAAAAKNGASGGVAHMPAE